MDEVGCADACGLLIRFKAFQGRRWLDVAAIARLLDTHSFVNGIVNQSIQLIQSLHSHFTATTFAP